MPVEAHHYQYLAELYLNKFIDREVYQAEKYLKRGLERYLEDIGLNIVATKYHLTKTYLVCRNDKKSSSVENKIAKDQNNCRIEAIKHYKRVKALFNTHGANSTNFDIMIDIADLHIRFGQIELAEKVYDNILNLDKDHVSALIGKGVIIAHNGNYKDSISILIAASLLDPENLNIQNRIADIHFNNGNYDESERIYRNILAISCTNQDALIGLGRLYGAFADLAKERNNKIDAEDCYQQAQELFTKAIDLQNPFNPSRPPSRRLSCNDLSFIYYSLGYINYSIYKMSLTRVKYDFTNLKIARSYFQKISGGTDNYSNGKSAIRKIDCELSQHLFLTTKAGKGLVMCFSIIILLLAQVGYFFKTGLRSLSDGPYIILTISCLAAIIIVPYIGQISRLKFGSFELEKAIIDQVNTNSEIMGITSSAIFAPTASLMSSRWSSGGIVQK